MNPDRMREILARRGVNLTDNEWSTVWDSRVTDLLTPPAGNPKVAKGLKVGVSTAILHLMPADGSGLQVCPNATDGCRAACLNRAGRGGMNLDADDLNAIQRARRRRTLWFFARRAEFMDRLVSELTRHEAKSRAAGLIPAARLNGTSDIAFERIPVERNGRRYPNIMRAFPRMRFYDYTKRTDRRDLPRNYHLTFSLAENNDAAAELALAAGINVAVVLSSPEIIRRAGTRYARLAPLPDSWNGRRVIDGDESDVRFRDPHGVYVGLRAKGRAVNDQTGFVRSAA